MSNCTIHEDFLTKLNVKTDHISGKVDDMEKHLANIDVNLAVYNERLAEHIRRTEILEENYGKVDERIRPLENFQAVEKIIRHAIYKTLAISGSILALLAGSYKLILFLVQHSTH